MPSYFDVTKSFNEFSLSNPERMIRQAQRLADHPETIQILHDIQQGHIDNGIRNKFMQAAVIDKAFHLAEHADVSTTNLVLFSSTLENQKRAEHYTNTNLDADLIHTTPAGFVLERLELFNQNLHIIDHDVSYLPWDILAFRLARETTSANVTAFVEGSIEASAFRMFEVPHLMANPHVLTINGDNKIQAAPLARQCGIELYSYIFEHGFEKACENLKDNTLLRKRLSKVESKETPDIERDQRTALWEQAAQALDRIETATLISPTP